MIREKKRKKGINEKIEAELEGTFFDSVRWSMIQSSEGRIRKIK